MRHNSEPDTPSPAQAVPVILESDLVVEARLGMRVAAFALDVILALAIIFLLLNKVFLPMHYGPELKEINGALTQYSTAIEMAHQNKTPAPTFTLSDDAQGMLDFTRTFIVGGFWIYFFLNSLCTQGSSLGKRVFRLKVISTQTFESLGIFDSAVRSGLKSITLCVFFPLLMVSYVIAFFNTRRLAGHDYLCKSIVIEDVDFEELKKELKQKRSSQNKSIE